MGKTQSKRSVDITTESKKSPEEEVTGKLEKIEDLDQKQVNGDASSQENAETEKKDGDETENDKDLTTEKSAGETGAQDGGGDTNTGQSSASTAESAAKEDDSTATKDGNKPSEEISPLSEENNKKPKKEKVKKKWSFRSISFGKKDKQKPAKTEEAAANENAAATNGDGGGAAQAGEETTEKNQKEETAGEAEAKKDSEKPAENGDATEKEMNGEKTSSSTPPTTPIEEQEPTKENTTNENATNNITNNTTETTTTSSVITETTTKTATENNQTEKQTNTTAAATKLAVETTESLTAIVSNGDAAAIEKNGTTETLSNTTDEQQQNEHLPVTDKAANLLVEEATSDVVVEKIKSIPKVASDVVVVAAENNGVHQNGTSANGDDDEEVLDNENESKTQVEVIFQTEQAQAHTADLVTLNATATISSSPQKPTTTPILFPDPNNTVTNEQIENSSSSKSVITDTNNEEATTIAAAENAAENIVEAEDVALKATIEPVSTAICDTNTQNVAEDINVDTGHEEPAEPESSKLEVEQNADQKSLHAEQQCADINEDLSKSTTSQVESPKPPPLPVSPPPSQVSVFAFNDNNQAVEEVEEEKICTTHNTDDIAVNEPTSQQPATNDTQQHIDEEATGELPTSNTFDIATGEPSQNMQHASNINNLLTETIEDVVVAPPQINVENDLVVSETAISKLSESIDENIENEELVKTATAVVNEISEKAVELIQQQKQLELDQPEMEISANANVELKTEHTNENHIAEEHIENNDITAHAQHISTEEVINVLESLNINCEDKNNLLKQETPLDELETHLIDCIKTTDKQLIVEGEEQQITTDICSQSVVSVNVDEHQN